MGGRPYTDSSEHTARSKRARCNLLSHSKAKFYELIGYPEGLDKHRDACRNKQCATIAEMKDEPEHVVERVTTLITSTSNERRALKASYSFANNTWIIDFGATVHMTFESKLIRNIRPSTQIDVTTTDGDAAPILRRVWHPLIIISTLILFS